MFKNIRNELEELKLEQAVLEHNRDPGEQNRLLDFYVNILPRITAAERCSIFIIDPDDKQVWLRTGTGVTEREIVVPESSSIVGRVIRSGTPMRLDHLEQEPGAHKATDAATGFVTREVLCVPIQGLNKGQIVGAIEILNKNNGVFNDEDQDLLTEAAYHIALFTDYIYLHQRVAKLSGKLYQAEKRALNITLLVMAAAAGALILFLLVLTFIPKLIS
jgi:GAF domain-containing protein